MDFTVTKAYGHVLKFRSLSTDHNVFQIASLLSIKKWQLPESNTLKMAKAGCIMQQVTQTHQNTAHF